MSGASSEKKHIIVVSSEPRVLAEIKMGLMDCFDVSIAAASAAAFVVLETYNIAAVVIYIGENRDKAFSVLADISEFVIKKSIPVIFLAENDDKEDEAAAFAVDAADYAVRRHGTAKALINRINLRIRASENEKRLLSGEGAPFLRAVTPEGILADKTILLAEDVELNRLVIANVFSDIKGLTLEFAGDGKEAVEKFAVNPGRYSLILMDVQMPEMDGLEATKAIRSLPCENAREIPIIALTASTEENERAMCLEAGMNDFLEKAMAYDELLKMAAEYCRAAPSAMI